MAMNITTGNLAPEPLQPGAMMVPAMSDGMALAGEVPEEAGGVNWGRYVAALKRYKWLMLGVVLVGTGAGAVGTRFIDPAYSVKATIYIAPEGGGGKKGGGDAGLMPVNDYTQLLGSFLVLDTVVQKMVLYLKPDRAKDSLAFKNFSTNRKSWVPGDYTLKIDAAGRTYSLARSGSEVEHGQVGDSVGRKVGFLWAPRAGQLGVDRKIRFQVTNFRDASLELQTNLRASVTEDGSFMKLSLGGTDPRRITGTLNSILGRFVAVEAELKRAKMTDLSTRLGEQVAAADSSLKEAENRLAAYQIKIVTTPSFNNALSPGAQLSTNAAQNNYISQKGQLEQIRTDRQAIETVLARAKAGAQTVDAFQTIAAVKGAPDLLKALGELSNLESDLRALLYRYTDQYKGVQDDKQKIETLKATTIPGLAQALVDQLKTQEADLDAKLAQAGTELKAIPEQTIVQNRLERDVAAKEGLFKGVQGSYEAAKLSAVSEVPDLRILDSAVVPNRPASSTAPKIILMALGASLGLAVALALLLDQLDRRFRYPEQVTQELGLSILGGIPAIRKVKGAELQPEEASQVVEAFRSVRLNLAHSYGAAGPVLLTVSSPGAGDGKSLVASNLAVSFAEAGYRTLLIDGDIRRGELHRMFSIDRRPGLLDYLSGTASAEEIIRPSSQRGLTIIPCGTRHRQGPELLGSAAMTKLMAEMKTRFNVVIVDSPPLGAGIDPFVLGTATGHMMIVMRSGETDRTMAEAKLKLLDRLPIRVLGAVLNDIQAEGIYRYYSYLYGYTADEEPAAPQLAGKTGEISREA